MLNEKNLGKYLFSFLIIVLLIGCQSFISEPIQNIRIKESGELTTDDATLTVMTFNIHCGGGSGDLGNPRFISGSKERLEKVAEAIAQIDPDILALQEVKGSWQAKFLAETLNMNYTYLPHKTRWWGLSILSKFPIIDSKTRVIISHSSSDGQSALISNIDLGENTISIVNVHYAYGHNYYTQTNETLKIAKTLHNPVILLGDFNRNPGDGELVPIKKIYVDTCEAIDTESAKMVQTRGTWYSSGGQRIDYVFVDPNFFYVIDVGLTAVWDWEVSDHLGYFAKIRLK